MVKSTKITNIKINKFYEWSFFWTFGLDFHSIGERGKKEKGEKMEVKENGKKKLVERHFGLCVPYLFSALKFD